MKTFDGTPGSHGTTDMAESSLLSSNSQDFKQSGVSVKIAGHKLARKGKRRFWERWYRRKYWAPEALCIVLATCIIIVLAAVLNHFNEQPISFWHAPITLNAFTALMATLLYMLLVSPISSSISQLKWVNFKSSHRLFDFHAGDTASRSSFGSFLYIVRGPPNALGSFGALLLLTTAAIGPLIQQIVHIETYTFPSSTAHGFVPVAHGYNNSPPQLVVPSANLPRDSPIRFTSLATANIPESVQDAIQLGVFSGQVTNYNVTASCPTGNCTYDQYSSLSIQSQCVNISDHLTFNKDVNSSWIDLLQKSKLGSGRWNSTLLKYGGLNIPLVTLDNDTNNYYVSAWDALLLTSPQDSSYFGWNFSASNRPTPFKGGFGRISAAYMSSVDSPILLMGNGGTFFNFQVIYLESYNNVELSSGWSFGASTAWECTLGFANNALSSESHSGNFTEKTNGDPAHIAAVEPGSTPRDYIANSAYDTVGGECYMRYSLEEGGLQDDCLDYFKGDNSKSCCNFTSLVAPRFDSISDNAEVSIDRWSLISLGYNLAKAFNGSSGVIAWGSSEITRSTAKDSIYGDTTGTSVTSNILHALISEVNGTAHNSSKFILPQMMDNVGKSMTKAIREFDSSTAKGTATYMETVYVVAWRWFTIPVLLLVLTVVLVAVTAWESRRHSVPIWASNSIATMVYGMEDLVRVEMLKFTEADDLREASKLINVRLDDHTRVLRAQ